jgi:zinc transport system ATP-binding protein
MRGAAVGYDDRPVIDGVDFELRPGEVVAVLGPNGSGKTTLVRGILGLARVIEGSLDLFGIPADQFRERYRIGYVPQRHTVVGTIPSTVREVVSSGRLARKRPFARSARADRAAVARAIDTVGLADRTDENLARLSGGQQRRALIARALAAEPDVLVMDEPTAGVDSANQQMLAATLHRLVTDGATLLIVTHEIGRLVPLITRAVVMRDGHIGYDGPLLPAMVGVSDGADAHEHGRQPSQPGGLGLTG